MESRAIACLRLRGCPWQFNIVGKCAGSKYINMYIARQSPTEPRDFVETLRVELYAWKGINATLGGCSHLVHIEKSCRRKWVLCQATLTFELTSEFWASHVLSDSVLPTYLSVAST